MTTVIINRFDGGVSNDPRVSDSSKSRVVTNFDVLTDQKRMTPYPSSETGATSQTDLKIKNFALGFRTASILSLYGLGVTTGTGRAEIYYKNLTTGSGTDLGDGGWAETTNNASSAGTLSYEFFTYYKKLSSFYGARAGTTVWQYDSTGTGAFDDSEHTFATSFTTLSNGIVHSKDDILYVGYDNYIAKNNNGSWTDPALSLPNTLNVASIAEYGSYLAIGCAPKLAIGSAVVYLWNRDSSLSTVSESVSWGEEDLKVLEELEGELIGISFGGASSSRLFNKIIFRRYVAGVGAVKFLELVSEDSSSALEIAKQKRDGRLYFMMSIKLNGTTREGLWSIGKHPSTGEWSLVHERTPNNDTALISGTLDGFFIVGDYVFQSFVTNSVETMTKTDNAETYTGTSIYESVINPKMDPDDFFHKKKLKSIGVMTEPLPSGAQVVLKLKVNGGSYNTVMTRSLDDETISETSILADGTEFTDGHEFEFRIESTGGAVVTGLIYRYETLDTLTN